MLELYFAPMKSLIIPITFTLLVSSCSHKISRVGYNTPASSQADCEVSVTYGPASSIDNKAQLLGSITLDDTGFSTNCNENDALAILKKEACSLKANTILITAYKEPSFASTCYRCSANFYNTTQSQTSTDSIPI